MNNTDILTLLTVFVLSAFVGFEVISKVPSVLHTPLMSGTNAIHGVVLVGSMAILGTAHGAIEIALGFIAVVLSTVNVVGGFVVTDRMLEMFKPRQPARAAAPEAAAVPAPPALEPEPAAETAPEPPAAEEHPAAEAPLPTEAPEPAPEQAPGEPTQFLSPEDMPPPPLDTEATGVLPLSGPDDTQLLRDDEEEEEES